MGGDGSGHVILLALEEPALPDYSVDERMEDPEKDLEYETWPVGISSALGLASQYSVYLALHGRRVIISVWPQDQTIPGEDPDSSSHHRPR